MHPIHATLEVPMVKKYQHLVKAGMFGWIFTFYYPKPALIDFLLSIPRQMYIVVEAKRQTILSHSMPSAYVTLIHR